MKTEIKSIGNTETVNMKAVPLIGEALLDGSVEVALEKLLNSKATDPMSDDELKRALSRIIR